MKLTRREFLNGCFMLAASAYLGFPGISSAAEEKGGIRKFHFSLSGGAPDVEPELLEIIRGAGVSTAWLPGYNTGNWWVSPDEFTRLEKTIRAAGMDVQAINIPLGHPSSSVENPAFGHPATRADGSKYTGTSIHSEAMSGNLEAIRQQKALNLKHIFLDDDFRLASSPGTIGGCFCDEHKAEFCRIYGYGDPEWSNLLNSVKSRDLTPVLRDWIDYNCDQLTSAFRKFQCAAAPEIDLGIMVMYMGSEKAGIRLSDYRNLPFRIGEMMFNDKSFGSVKGKTDELFSSLFHRRFVKPDLAYSESTAAPPDRLSGKNMAAKLCVSTISDVRNTMFMFSLKVFPREHWQVIAPAMRKNAAIHEYTANRKPCGPFKHYWGESSRYVGDDKPFSLFLASGVPFEVTRKPAADGWTFLSDFDARAAQSGVLKSAGTKFVRRSSADGDFLAVPESMDEMFAFKKRILPSLKDVPYVEEDVPAVCTWYPDAKAVLLWNLTEERQKLTVRFGKTTRRVPIDPLDIELVKKVTQL